MIFYSCFMESTTAKLGILTIGISEFMVI